MKTIESSGAFDTACQLRPPSALCSSARPASAHALRSPRVVTHVTGPIVFFRTVQVRPPSSVVEIVPPGQSQQRPAPKRPRSPSQNATDEGSERPSGTGGGDRDACGADEEAQPVRPVAANAARRESAASRVGLIED